MPDPGGVFIYAPQKVVYVFSLEPLPRRYTNANGSRTVSDPREDDWGLIRAEETVLLPLALHVRKVSAG